MAGEECRVLVEDGHLYAGPAPSARSTGDYTVQVIPGSEGARLPAELPLIIWQK
jgi:hypothetical protein